MHWIHTAFPVGHHGQTACAPCQRMLHTSFIRLLPVRSKGNGICHLPPVLFMTFFQCIQKGQRTAIPVPLPKWGDPFFRNSGSKAFVVFCDTGMLLLMIVFLQIDSPETVQFFQCPDIFKLRFTDKVIPHLMELFNLAFPGTWFCMHDTDPQPGK